jgi:hypothetical protein
MPASSMRCWTLCYRFLFTVQISICSRHSHLISCHFVSFPYLDTLNHCSQCLVLMCLCTLCDCAVPKHPELRVRGQSCLSVTNGATPSPATCNELSLPSSSPELPLTMMISHQMRPVLPLSLLDVLQHCSLVSCSQH